MTIEEMRDLQECLREDLKLIGTRQVGPADARVINQARKWIRNVPFTPGNGESVRFYSSHVRRICVAVLGKHPNPLGLKRT